MVYLTRIEHFNAAHKLYNPDWTPEKNEEVFGRCANANWHGHNFELFVTIKGKPDPETGRLSAEHLAKAYLWLAAALQRSQDPEEIIAAKAIMQEILVIMPETWLASLNQKVTQHLQEQKPH